MSSSSILPVHPLNAAPLFGELTHNALGGAVADGYLPHMVWGKGKPPRDAGNRAGQTGGSLKVCDDRGGLNGQNKPRYESDTNTGLVIRSRINCLPRKTASLPLWASRIKELRKSLGLNQIDFADLLGVKQTTVSKWEVGDHKPTPDTFVKVATHAPDVQKMYFLHEAGLPDSYFMGEIQHEMPSHLVAASIRVVGEAYGATDSLGEAAKELAGLLHPGSGGAGKAASVIRVPVLADPMAAGNPVSINESDIAEIMFLPGDWFPRGSIIYGIRVQGHSMHPVLHERDIALINVARRSAQALHNHIVAARVGDGITVKRLRKSGVNFFLVPENTSPEYGVTGLGKDQDWAILGDVVRWIASPLPKKEEEA